MPGVAQGIEIAGNQARGVSVSALPPALSAIKGPIARNLSGTLVLPLLGGFGSWNADQVR